MGEQLRRAMDALVEALCQCGVKELESLAEFKKRLVLKAMKQEGWNQCAAAARLGIHRNTLARQMEELGIEIPKEHRTNRKPGRFERSPLKGIERKPLTMSAAAGR